MSRKFDLAKWFGRTIAFLIIFSPMITTQFSMDRMAIERAVKSEDISECYQIKREYFFKICKEKIVRKKDEYCKRKPSENCHRIMVQPSIDHKSRGSDFWLMPIEILLSIIIALWAMGLTPERIENKMPNQLANISTSDSFIFYRIPIALIIFLASYYLFQFVHGLYS